MSAETDKEQDNDKSGLIAWMATHNVAANLLMLICLFGGFYILTKTTKEVFPTFALDSISIRMSYPGASPEEVEQAIVLAIEDVLADVEGIGEISSIASEGSARISVEVLDPENMMRINQDIKSATDRISTFPVEAEDLTVTINSRRRDVMELALYGDLNPTALREAAEQLKEKLQANPDIGPVELTGAKEKEIHIEVTQENLRRYKLTLSDIASRIRAIAIELGGGRLRTEQGEILVRLTERRDKAVDFENIPIITLENGSQVFLGDIATIREGFEDKNESATFNGKPAILMDVYRVGSQTPTGVAQAVYKELENLSSFLPEELNIGIADDDSKLFEQRAALMLKNGFFGLILVMIFLALFLDFRLAFWVGMGIPISFLGAFLIFPFTDFTINIVSMFAFIIALGIVVDDAIVSGENIYSFRQRGYPPAQAAIEGAREISLPITISVITNMVAFLPLMFIPGVMGKVFSVIPIVVIAVFAFSLIECLLILPAHLTFKKAKANDTGQSSALINLQKKFNSNFENFVSKHYGSFIKRVIKNRYLTFAIFMALLIGLGGYVFSGRMGMQLFPRVESDYAFAAATLKVGAPEQEINQVSSILLKAANEVIKENGQDLLSTGIYATIEDNKAEVRVFLTDPKIRPVSTAHFTKVWREKVGEIPGLESLNFQSNRGGPGSGASLTVELSHRDTEILDEAAIKLAAALEEFPMTKDIDDGSAQGKAQYDFKMKELGYLLGLTSADVARQVRAGFYGSEAFKQQRGRDEIRVLVRLPEHQRDSEYFLKSFMLRAPNGAEILLKDAVFMEKGRAYTTINRRDGRRNVQVKADVEPPDQTNRVINALKKEMLPELVSRYPGLSYSFEGRQAEIRDSVTSLFWGLLAVLFIMYALLAVLFSSYLQPFMVLIAIPFSAVGAVIGHFIMGYSLSVMSLFGMMALAGVVVNGALVLINFANRKRARGISMSEALIESSVQRFRPILLTTLTTFVGLAPMILETSRQAKFLIPMALSLGFGILFSIFVTLILIPALYVILEDVKKLSSFYKILKPGQA
jgi:multidrug efflux pump subunit AcrB